MTGSGANDSPSRPSGGNPRAIAAILAEGFFSRFAFGLISFALPLYAVKLGMGLGAIGLLVSFNLAVAMVLKPLGGWASDRFGIRRAARVGLALRAIVGVLLALAAAPWQLYTARATHGVSRAIRDPAMQAMISEHGGERHLASAFAWYQAAKSLAGSTGKAVAGVLLTAMAAGYSVVFALAALLSAVPILLLRSVPEVRPRRRAAEAPRPHRPPIGRAFTLALVISAPAKMVQSLFPVLATEYAGLTEAQTGVIYLASAGAALVAGPLFGWLTDRGRRGLVLGMRSVANAISAVVYGLSPGLAGMVTGKVIDDLGKASFRPAWGSLMADLSSTDRRHRAQTMSLMSLGQDAGGVGGPILGGLIWQQWGVVVLLVVRFFLAVGAKAYTTWWGPRLLGAAPRGDPT